MPVFTTEKKLHSLHLTVEALQQIERYLFDNMCNILKIDPIEFKEKYEINILDDFGTEQFNTIEDFRLKHFSNSTRGIHLSSRTYKSGLNRFDLNFKSSECAIIISFENENARDKVIAVLSGLDRITDQFRTNNFLYHPPLSINVIETALLLYGSPFLVIMYLSGKLTSLSDSYPHHVSAILVAYYLSGLHYFLGKIKPYCSFDTMKHQRYSKLYEWLLYGILGFLIFGTLFPYFRKSLFGF